MGCSLSAFREKYRACQKERKNGIQKTKSWVANALHYTHITGNTNNSPVKNYSQSEYMKNLRIHKEFHSLQDIYIHTNRDLLAFVKTYDKHEDMNRVVNFE